MSAATYGILGVGSLASFLVIGLCDGVDDAPSVLLSPRNAERAASLAERFPSVSVATDNQAVVDGSDVVLVCLRRVHADLLQDLRWRPDHVVVSAVAGLPLGALAEMVGPAEHVARAVAMPAVASRTGVTPVHPPLPQVVELFATLGGAMEVEDADQFEAIYTSMGTVAPFYEYLGVLVRFLGDHGVDRTDAQRLVADTFIGVLTSLTSSENLDFDELVREHAPPGGGNEQLTTLMREAGVFDGMARSVEAVHDRLTGRGVPPGA